MKKKKQELTVKSVENIKKRFINNFNKFSLRSLRLMIFFFTVNDVLSTNLFAQQLGMGPGQQRRHTLGWNSQSRSQYGAQMKQNQIGLQQQQQSRWQQSSDGQQSIQPQRQRRGWNAATRNSYQQQMQQNHLALQQQQQSRWGQSSLNQARQGQGESQGQPQQGGQSLKIHQRGNWDAATRRSYQQQMQQNHEALQQQKETRWKQNSAMGNG